MMKKYHCFEPKQIEKIEEDSIKEFLYELKSSVYSQKKLTEKIEKTVYSSKADKLADQKKNGYYLFIRDKSAASPYYYVMYKYDILNDKGEKIDEGITTKYSTGKTDYTEAVAYAKENKIRLIDWYKNHSKNEIEKIMSGFFLPEGTYQKNANEADKLQEKMLSNYNGICMNYFLPFFQERNIQHFSQIEWRDILNLREYMREKGLSTRTVSSNMTALKKILQYLYIKKIINENLFSTHTFDVMKKGENETDNSRIFYPEQDELVIKNHVFKDFWPESHFNYMLTLAAFSTGLRPSELIQISMKDIVKFDEVFFINLDKIGNKTVNAKRFLPLPDFVYQKFVEWQKENNLTDEQPLLHIYDVKEYFPFYGEANKMLCDKLKFSQEERKNQNITFYGASRHFYITLLAAAGITEQQARYFVGHVSDEKDFDYVHLGQIGKTKIAAMGRPIVKLFEPYYQ